MLTFCSRFGPVVFDKFPTLPGRLNQFPDYKLTLLVLLVGKILSNQVLLGSVGDIDAIIIIDIEIARIVPVKPDRIDKGTDQPDPLLLVSY